MKYFSRTQALGMIALILLGTVVPAAPAAVSVGDRPNIDFTATDGTRVTSDALKGRIVIVDFWATWCGPCVASMPHMIELNNQYASKGVQILGISLDKDRRAMDRFVNRKKMTWPQYFDGRGWKNQMAKAWGVNSIPRVFIISPEGQVLWGGSPSRLDQHLEKALREHPPKPPDNDTSPSSIELRDLAVSALRKARAVTDTNDAGQLLSLVAEVPDEVLADRRVLANARVLLAKLELNPEATEALQAAKEANPEAAERFAALAEAVRNAAPAANEDPRHAAVHPKLVASKLAQAEKASEADQHYRAYTLYDWLLDRVPDTQAGFTAAQRLAELESDVDKMAVIRTEKTNQQAKALISLAQNYEAAGNHDLARATYEKVLVSYEDATECCDMAKAALAEIE